MCVINSVINWCVICLWLKCTLTLTTLHPVPVLDSFLLLCSWLLCQRSASFHKVDHICLRGIYSTWLWCWWKLDEWKHLVTKVISCHWVWPSSTLPSLLMLVLKKKKKSTDLLLTCSTHHQTQQVQRLRWLWTWEVMLPAQETRENNISVESLDALKRVWALGIHLCLQDGWIILALQAVFCSGVTDFFILF